MPGLVGALRDTLFGRPAQGGALARRMPLFVDVRYADCLVVGAGAVGMRRARVLASFGARVTLADPALPAGADLSEGMSSLGRGWRAGDEVGRALVCAATDSRSVNHEVAEACRALRIPVSVSDDPADCTFYFPAICTSRRLTAGIVSHGAEHSLGARVARKVRETLAGEDVAAGDVDGEV